MKVAESPINNLRITYKSPKNHLRITKESLKIYSGYIVILTLVLRSRVLRKWMPKRSKRDTKYKEKYTSFCISHKKTLPLQAQRCVNTPQIRKEQ